MRKILLLAFCLAFISFGHSQETYTIDGEKLELRKEVDGTIDLLWNVVEGKYRYFVSKNGSFVELKNTRGEDKKYREEFKETLASLTGGSISTEKLNLTLFSLREFLNDYNASTDPDFKPAQKRAKLQSRLLLFGGITNSPFIENPENTSNPVVGAEIEFFENRERPRHSLLFQVKYTNGSDDFKYSSTQLGVGYRFRFISKPSWSLYTTIMGATYNISKIETSVADMVIKEDDSTFDAPVSFGVGVDIRIFENGFLTISYDELFAIFVENQGNFSTNITAGIKFSL